MADWIEFNVDGELLTRVQSSFAPDVGEQVNIQKFTYEVTSRAYVFDYTGTPHMMAVCYINMKKI